MARMYVILDDRGHAYGWDEDAETAWGIAASELDMTEGGTDDPPVGPLHIEEFDPATHHVGWVCDANSTVPYLGIAEGREEEG